jgi:Tfp pilus assembly protein PilF
MKPSRYRSWFLYATLAAATTAVYWPVGHFEFVNYDDDIRVYGNPHVTRGLTLEGLRWAFTTFEANNWHPVLWLSHMLDCQLFGLRAGAHHWVNVLLHVVNTLLLFALLQRMTGAIWPSAFVAAAFAWHPTHVESVAWVTERKDVLSTLFGLLTLAAYLAYIERRSWSRYALVVSLFALGLMSKPMLVTLPLVLLLLDAWPLRRITLQNGPGARRSLLLLVAEKAPLIVMALAASAVTYWAQSASDSGVAAVKAVPWAVRICQAVIAPVAYLDKIIWPVNLTVLYPYSGTLKLSAALVSAVALGVVTTLALGRWRSSPYLAVGWLWYLGTLAPVSGSIQVGDQSMADRYTYVPSIGIFMLAAWALADCSAGLRSFKVAVGTLAIGVLAIWMAGTSRQLRHWRSSVTLFERAIAVTGGNYVAHNNLGAALRDRGELAEAAAHFEQAICIWAEFPEAHKNLADLLAQAGRFHEAVEHYRRAIRAMPKWSDAHNNLGFALAAQGNLAEAIPHFREAVRLNPGLADAHLNLGVALMKQENFEESQAQLAEALRRKPSDAQAQYLMGAVLQARGRKQEAAERFEAALRLNPNYAEARRALETLRD